MTRRSLFQIALGALCAPFLPKPKAAGLMWHKDAFAFMMAPLQSIEPVTHPTDELFIVSGGEGYIYRLPS